MKGSFYGDTLIFEEDCLSIFFGTFKQFIHFSTVLIRCFNTTSFSNEILSPNLIVWKTQNKRTFRELLSATLTKSGPLHFTSKSFLLFFAHGKGLGHVSKLVYLFSNSLFSRCYKPKIIFGQYTRVDSDRKCRFHRFCPACSDCNNIAHGILSCYKLRGAFNYFTDKIWKLQLKYFSYKRDQRRVFYSTFICLSKFTNFYERNLKMQASIGLKMHVSV